MISITVNTALAAGLLLLAYLAFSFFQRLFLSRNRFLRSIGVVLNLSVLYLCVKLFLHWGHVVIGQRGQLWMVSAGVMLGCFLAIRLLEFLLLDMAYARNPTFQVPMLLRDIVRWLLAVMVGFLILRVNLGINLTPLLATSAALTFIMGFALQDVLGNLFAGIVLNLEKPFSIGDWVQIKQQTGIVENMTWRATRIRTFTDDHVVIPNAEIARNEIVNYSHPTTVHARELDVGVVYEAQPTKVKFVIREACGGTAGILPHPEPKVWLVNYGDFAITYRIKFWIDDYSQIHEIEDDLMTSLWYNFKRNGIVIPFPIRNVTMRTVTPRVIRNEQAARQRRALNLLRAIPLLAPLPAASLRNLAARVGTRVYRAGETLVQQGDPGNWFCIIEEGEVEVSITGGEGQQVRAAVLGPGKVFGEMSLLAGERRSATIRAIGDVSVLVIEKHDFAPILEHNPRTAGVLAKIIEQRQRANLETIARTRRLSKAERSAATTDGILKRIRMFFGLSRGGK